MVLLVQIHKNNPRTCIYNNHTQRYRYKINFQPIKISKNVLGS